MPLFTNAQNTNIHGGTFTDVQGGIHNYQGDPILQSLFQTTAPGAAYNSQERHPPPKCYPGTREAILKAVEEWVASGENGERGSVMWLHGPAGAGKSAIAQTVCESNANRGWLAAGFFFSREHTGRDSIDAFATTIAFQLAMSSQDLRDRIGQVIHRNPGILQQTMTGQVENLIRKPTQSRPPRDAGVRSPFLIVVDGLDECRHNTNQSLVLTNLIDLIRKYRLDLHILIVSRPEAHIKHFFHGVDMENFRSFSLHGDHQADADIAAFLRGSFQEIHDAECHSDIMKAVKKPWPSREIVNELVAKSGGYFIYASTVVRFVGEEYFSPIDRLKDVLDPSSTSSTTAFAELDRLYAQILSTSPKRALLKRILGCVLRPWGSDETSVTPAAIELLLGLTTGVVMLTLRGLHSLILFKPVQSVGDVGLDSGEMSLHSIHASLADFAFNEERAGLFFIDRQEHYTFMTLNCWRRFAEWPSGDGAEFPLWGRRHLLDSFSHHFMLISDKRQVVVNFRIPSTATWSAFVHASQNWHVRDKHMILHLVENVLLTLEKLRDPPQDIIQELTALLDFIYSVHVLSHSVGDTQFIQGLFTMFPKTWEILLETSDEKVLELAEFLHLSNLQQPYWKDIYDYLYGSEDPLCRGMSFMDFMGDPVRCGDLFIDPGICHARLALCSMVSLVEREPSTSAYMYARDCLATHLSRAAPGEKGLLDYLQSLDPRKAFADRDRVEADPLLSYHIEEVIAWLERAPNRSRGVLSPWKKFLKNPEPTRERAVLKATLSQSTPLGRPLGSFFPGST